MFYPCRQPLSLPAEISVFISRHLEQNDLINCVLVCKAWNKDFTPALFIHIHVSPSGYHAFTSPKILQQVANNARRICSITVPHPTFAHSLLEAVAAVPGRTEPWFPNLKSVSIAFDRGIYRSLKVPVPQPQFLYPSDLEDLTDDSMDDSDDDIVDSNSKSSRKDNTSQDPIESIYSALLAPYFRIHDTAADPYGVFRLLCQCPGLRNLKVHFNALCNTGGLDYLLQPGLLPQSLERLEIVVPFNWNEESYENSDDEDYDPALNSARDVAEEYEEDEVHDLSDGSSDGYDEDAVVDWYHTELQSPEMPTFWNGRPIRIKNYDPQLNQPLLNLRELAITNAEEVRRHIMNFIVTRCPNLRSIHMIEPSDHLCELFFHGRATLPSKLTELRVEIKEHQGHFVDGEYMSCLLSSAGWRNIVIRNFFHMVHVQRDALLEKALTIEVLDLGIHAGSLRSATIQQFLSRASRLRVFSGEGLYFLARFAIRQPWACAETLEVLRCQIFLEVPQISSLIDPPRLIADADEVEDQDTVLSQEDLQRLVMKQLGRCYRLQELDLSHWRPENYEIRGPHGLIQSVDGFMGPMTQDRYMFNIDGCMARHGPTNANVRLPWTMKRQSKCLEFTFKTGLRELEELKELRKVNLTGLKHRVSIEELKWMREAWPQLQQFEGLFANGEEDEDHEEDENREDRRKREEGIRQWLEGGEIIQGDCTFWRTSK
ncbi:hypothetical protein EDD11_010139 [Mortierella claussenii]|nr:hypothetical protein EDD11_010139 [Mortierella claussenii]